MDPEARKVLLIEATLRCLKKYGFQGTSVRRICAEADVSVGLINHHYPGKDALVVETYLYLSRTTMLRLRTATEQAGASPRARLSAFISASFSPEILDPTLLESWISFWGAVRSSVTMTEAHDASYSEYCIVLADCLRSLAIEQKWEDFNAKLAAIALSALLDGLWLESGLNPNSFTPTQGVQMCEAWVNGLIVGGHHSYR